MTLRALSAASGLSVGFLSQIERGLSSFSISSLRSVCQALEVSLADVLVTSSETGNAILVDPRHAGITKADNRSHVSLSDSSIMYRFLSTGLASRRFDAVIGEMAPGSHSDAHRHEGEEFGYVLKGEIVLIADDEEHDLGPGDSYHLMASSPHTCDAGSSGAKVLWVQTARYVRALSLLGKEALSADALPPPMESGDRPAMVNLSQDAVRYRFLTGNLPGAQLRVFIGEIPAEREEEPTLFNGEEFGYMLKGEIHLRVESDSYPLGIGDCYHVAAESPRGLKVDGESAAQLLWVQMGVGSQEAEEVWLAAVEDAAHELQQSTTTNKSRQRRS